MTREVNRVYLKVLDGENDRREGGKKGVMRIQKIKIIQMSRQDKDPRTKNRG